MTNRTKKIIICSVCTHTIKSKDYLLCADCNDLLDLKCASITQKRFNTMSIDSKTKWKCHKCRNLLNNPETSKTPKTSSTKVATQPTKEICSKKIKPLNFLNRSLANVTSSSVEDHSTLKDISVCSLPDLSTTDNSRITDLKHDIVILSSQLESAHEEIAKLSLENSNFKKQIDDNEKQLKIYKTLLNDDITSGNSTPIRSKKRKTKMASSAGTPILKTPNLTINKERFSTPIDNVDQGNFSTPKELIVTQEAFHITEQKLGNESENNQKHRNEPTQYTIKSESSSGINVRSPRVVILGDQIVKGLSSEIVMKRQSQWNDVYKIFSIVKPQATASQVLNSCDDLLKSLKKDDIVIIGIGSNEKNPYSMLSALSYALCQLKQYQVFVLNVFDNPHLNVKLLNNSINFNS